MQPTNSASPGRKGFRFNECVYIEHLGLTYQPISKNGSSTTLRGLRDAHPAAPCGIAGDELPSPGVVMLRDPTKRAWSSYLWHTRPSMGDLPDELPPGDLWHPDPHFEFPRWLQALAERTDYEEWSPSIAPQSTFLRSAVPYTMVPWDFAALGRLLQVEFGHENKRQVNKDTPDITPEMQYHLNLVYGADYRIWELIS